MSILTRLARLGRLGLDVQGTGPVAGAADSAYGTGDARAALTEAGHTAVIKPIPLRTPIPGGFTTDDFTVDLDAGDHGIVTCPAGHTVAIRPSGGAAFERHCRTCPLATRCTTAKRGRKLTIHPHERLLRAARQAARDPDWQTEYRQHRPMVERVIAWLTRGARKLRYRGITKNNHWLHHRIAGLNLRRLITLGLTPTPERELGTGLTPPRTTTPGHASHQREQRPRCQPLRSDLTATQTALSAPQNVPYSGHS